jgi:hypothetical protein
MSCNSDTSPKVAIASKAHRDLWNRTGTVASSFAKISANVHKPQEHLVSFKTVKFFNKVLVKFIQLN